MFPAPRGPHLTDRMAKSDIVDDAPLATWHKNYTAQASGGSHLYSPSGRPARESVDDPASIDMLGFAPIWARRDTLPISACRLRTWGSRKERTCPSMKRPRRRSQDSPLSSIA